MAYALLNTSRYRHHSTQTLFVFSIFVIQIDIILPRQFLYLLHLCLCLVLGFLIGCIFTIIFIFIKVNHIILLKQNYLLFCTIYLLPVKSWCCSCCSKCFPKLAFDALVLIKQQKRRVFFVYFPPELV